MEKINETFYEYYLSQNRIKDIENQKNCVLAAISIKSYIEGKTKSVPKIHKWLLEKLEKNIHQEYRGQLVKKNVLGIINEIIDDNNSSSKIYWSKSPRKQKIEELQRNFIFLNHNIEILAGKKSGICASGTNSYRFMYDTFEFKKGINKKEGLTTKSMDGIINLNGTKIGSKCWVFQKVTTDDGGSTNSVEEEVIKTINVANKHVFKFKSEDVFIFLLDGPYWGRKQSKKDDKTRFDKIYKMASPNIIICDSNTIKIELEKRNLISEN
jgi:hypothetical protein